MDEDPKNKDSETEAPSDQSEISDTSEGIRLVVARTLDEVLQSWRLVYDAYVRVGLIKQNPYHLHMAPQAAHPSAAVLSASIHGLLVSTLTAIVDRDDLSSSEKIEGRLPLDRVFGPHLDRLRSDGHRLMEVGLFADRRKHLSRTAESLFQFMRLAFFFGISEKITDFIIGVHPRHVGFYVRFFGFVREEEEKLYPAVNDRPVALLRLNIASQMASRPLHKVLAFFVDNPADSELFQSRFTFSNEDIRGTAIEAWLKAYHTCEHDAQAA